MPYRVIRSAIDRVRGETYEPGDRIEPTDAELQAFSENLEYFEEEDDDGPEDDAAAGDEAPPDPPFDPGDATVVELRDMLADRPDSVTDAELDALYEAEQAGEARTTALEAIDDARED